MRYGFCCLIAFVGGLPCLVGVWSGFLGGSEFGVGSVLTVL